MSNYSAESPSSADVELSRTNKNASLTDAKRFNGNLTITANSTQTQVKLKIKIKNYSPKYMSSTLKTVSRFKIVVITCKGIFEKKN